MKNLLKNKFFISIILLLTFMIVSNSCFATNSDTYTYGDFSIVLDKDSKTLTITNSKYDKSRIIDISHGLNNYTNYYLQINKNNPYSYSEFYNIGLVFSNSFSWLSKVYNGVTTYTYGNADSYCYFLNFNVLSSDNSSFNLPWGETDGFAETTNVTIRGAYSLQLNEDSSTKYAGQEILSSNHIIYKPNNSILFSESMVRANYTFETDSSAKVTFELKGNAPTGSYLKYSISGIVLNSDITKPPDLRNPTNYNFGTNITVKPNTKVYYSLYNSNGDVIEHSVLQVPKYDAVAENSDKDINYEVEYNSDKTSATIRVSVTNREFSDKLYYSSYPPTSTWHKYKKLFPSNNTMEITTNCDVNLILTDAFDNIIAVDCVTINKLSIISDNLFKVNIETKDREVMLYPRLYGLDTDKYFIEFKAKLDNFTSSKDIDVYINNSHKGNIEEISNNIYKCGSDNELKFSQNIGTSNVTVTFFIKNLETNEICITRTVSFKIGLNKEDSGVTGSTTNGVDDDSFITSDGTNSQFGGDYPKVSWKDIQGQISTNSSFWQMIKQIFSCLPTWITAPLFFFISGVVIICLTKIVLSVVTSIFG